MLLSTLASRPPGKLFFVSQSPAFSEVCCVLFLRQSSLRLGLLFSSFRPEAEQLMPFFLRHDLLRCGLLVRFGFWHFSHLWHALNVTARFAVRTVSIFYLCVSFFDVLR